MDPSHVVGGRSADEHARDSQHAPNEQPRPGDSAEHSYQHSAAREEEEDEESEAAGPDWEGAMPSPEDAMNSVFSVRRPRDIVAGLTSGVKSVAKGALLGTASLVVGPIVGAAAQGVRGLIKGIAGGIIGAALFPTVGTIVGVIQIVRGVFNTPFAIFYSVRGRHWDTHTREWVVWDPTRAIVLEAPSSALDRRSDNNAHEPTAANIDADDYFLVLGVSRNASPEDLRRQYYRLAREYHPDKNPDDPAAHARFQRLSRAYQVLSNPTLRETYEQRGEEAVQGPGEIDPSLIFSMLFGSDQFTDYVGELFLAAGARLGPDIHSVAMQRAQLERVIFLAAKLTERLDRCERGKESEFAATVRGEAMRLVRASFGDVMLKAVATAYKSAADQARGGLSGFTAGMAHRVRSVKHHFRMLRHATSLLAVAEQAHAAEAEDARESREATPSPPPPTAPVPAAAAATTSSSAASGSQAAPAGAAASPASDTSKENAPAPAKAAASSAAAAAGPASSDEAEDVDMQGSAGAAAGGGAYERVPQQDPAEALPMYFDAMWAANVIDIDKVLRVVCRVVLYGNEYGAPAVPAAERRARTAALSITATEFLGVVANAHHASEIKAHERLERAMEAAARKAYGLDPAEFEV
eukprot:m.237758 g.237758  ORF g.237758 m.237758 type:complete len:638 (-) comp21368_c0_seq1:32-1945(-)